jgi:hypothetical protein
VEVVLAFRVQVVVVVALPYQEVEAVVALPYQEVEAVVALPYQEVMVVVAFQVQVVVAAEVALQVLVEALQADPAPWMEEEGVLTISLYTYKQILTVQV